MANHLEGSLDQPVVDQIILAFKQDQLQVIVVGSPCYSGDQVVDFGVSVEVPSVRLHQWVLILLVSVSACHGMVLLDCYFML